MSDTLTRFYEVLSFGGILISPLYLAAFVAIGWLIYKIRREERGFWAWLFPRKNILSRSSRLDLLLFAVVQVILYLGLFARFAATPAVATFVAGLIPAPLFAQAPVSPLLVGLLFFLAHDFALYWAHRAHHDINVIWPLHAVHHSAEVLTPITAFRMHPLSLLLTTAFNTVVAGTLLGVLVGTFGPDTTPLQIFGVNAFVLTINLTLTNFHHSHIWVSFGPILERIIISPAQHQVHHSTKPAHFNKNFGQSLAIWDWMFGTLYLTKHDESVTFGLTGKADALLGTHRLLPIIWDPIRRIAALAMGKSDV